MKPSNEKPSAAEYGTTRAWLAQKGVKQAHIDQYLPKGGAATMTRAQIVDKISEMCRTFPRR